MSAASPQPVILLATYPDGSQTGIVFDASVNETHGMTAQVSEHQVESGPNVTDNIRPLPRRISVQGIITNNPIALSIGQTPLTQIGGASERVADFKYAVSANGRTTPVAYTATQFSAQFDRVGDAYAEFCKSILGIVETDSAPAQIVGVAIFTLTTTLKTYNNLAVTNFSAQRNAEFGNALFFTVDFQELRIVSTQEVAALPSQKQLGKNKGAQAPKPVTPATETQVKSQSLLFKVLGG